MSQAYHYQTGALQSSHCFQTELKKYVEIEPEADTRQTVLGYSLVTIKPPNYSEVKYSPCLQVNKADAPGASVEGRKVVILAQPYPLGEGFW